MTHTKDPDLNKTFESLCQYTRGIVLLESTQSLLEWDERTKLPEAAGDYRAEQITNLAGLIHERKTAPQLGEWLNELASSPLVKDAHGDTATTIRQLNREYDKKVKLPPLLVEELTRTSVLGQQAWVKARKDNDFATFAPFLEKLVHLKQQQADAIGYQEQRYDALLDEYEPRESAANVTRILSELREQLTPLVGAIAQSKKAPPVEVLHRRFPPEMQEIFGKKAAAQIGFDFTRGRLDKTDHPFCTSMGPNDCRITTRYYENFFNPAFFGIMHEAGHGIYDQGLRSDQFGLPPGTFLSLGMHESQSRLWENFVGRSQSFWTYFFPLAKQSFPDALNTVSLDQFYFAINAVKPSLIRVEADEATYNLHIIIRFELEQALLDGDLKVADLPHAWRDKYQKYLGIRPHDDADGVLQDSHWSAGAIGYFPTYTLGNLYAAQFFATADRELGGLDTQFAKGIFQPLLQWLKKNIHERGQCYTSSELVKLVTGKPLSPAPLMNYLRAKLEPLYNL